MPTYTHDDPFRLRVQKAMGSLIKGVTPANGYRFDLSDFADEAGRPRRRVFRGRDDFGSNDPLPMVAILEDPRAMDAENGSEGSSATKGRYRLFVQGFVKDDHENPTDPAHRLAAEVICALVEGKRDDRNILGMGHKKPCVTEMTIGQPVVRPADNETSSVAFFFVAVTLQLVEDLEDPFS
jgi:hypothetical protein